MAAASLCLRILGDSLSAPLHSFFGLLLRMNQSHRLTRGAMFLYSLLPVRPDGPTTDPSFSTRILFAVIALLIFTVSRPVLASRWVVSKTRSHPLGNQSNRSIISRLAEKNDHKVVISQFLTSTASRGSSSLFTHGIRMKAGRVSADYSG